MQVRVGQRLVHPHQPGLISHLGSPRQSNGSPRSQTREGRLITLKTAHGPIIQAPHVTSSPINSSPEQSRADQVRAPHVSPMPVRLWRREGVFWRRAALRALLFYFFSLAIASWCAIPEGRRRRRSAEGRADLLPGAPSGERSGKKSDVAA